MARKWLSRLSHLASGTVCIKKQKTHFIVPFNYRDGYHIIHNGLKGFLIIRTCLRFCEVIFMKHIATFVWKLKGYLVKTQVDSTYIRLNQFWFTNVSTPLWHTIIVATYVVREVKSQLSSTCYMKWLLLPWGQLFIHEIHKL